MRQSVSLPHLITEMSCTFVFPFSIGSVNLFNLALTRLGENGHRTLQAPFFAWHWNTVSPFATHGMHLSILQPICEERGGSWWHLGHTFTFVIAVLQMRARFYSVQYTLFVSQLIKRENKKRKKLARPVCFDKEYSASLHDDKHTRKWRMTTSHT